MRYLIVAAIYFSAAAAHAEAPPTDVGKCVNTRISKVSSYFADSPLGEGGSMVEFENGVTVMDQGDNVEAIRSRKGDPVAVCLDFIPTDCPPGDDRGRVYTVHNKSTGTSFQMMDSPHMCGGA